MRFNSYEFAIFFAGLLPAYWLLQRHRGAQNVLLLVAGYYFYACWNPKFLSLLCLSTVRIVSRLRSFEGGFGFALAGQELQREPHLINRVDRLRHRPTGAARRRGWRPGGVPWRGLVQRVQSSK